MLRNHIRLVVILILFLLAASLSAQDIKDSNSINYLKQEIGNLSKDISLKHALLGLSVINVKSGKTIYEYNSQLSLVPASTLKIVTTAATLSTLGKNYRFKTSFEYDGFIDSFGVLNGNLYIKGGGDPTIGSERFGKQCVADTIFNKFLLALKKLKISKVNGSVIGDESNFEYNLSGYGWSWGDIGNYYGSGVSGLNIYENNYVLTFQPGKNIGDQAILIKTEPELIGYKLVNNVKTAGPGTGDNACIFGAPYADIRYIEGTIPAGVSTFTIKGAIPDPAFLFAEELEKYLVTNGITINGQPTTIRKLITENNLKIASKTTITTYLSPALEKIVQPLNFYSINIYAEAFLKIMGLEKTGKGTTEAGINVVRRFWENKKIDLSGFKMTDGCGLSRLDLITTEQLSKMLCVISKDSCYSAFYKSLPVAGVSGTMAKLLQGTTAENNLRAKTGTMSGLRAYAGYVTTRNKIPLSFAVIVNNYEGNENLMKDKIEKLLLRISEIR
jgi:serine-type D-Ala-D-Ala carboxypeptidase/endopeptidase (penicillin-binding protein 4)